MQEKPRFHPRRSPVAGSGPDPPGSPGASVYAVALGPARVRGRRLPGIRSGRTSEGSSCTDGDEGPSFVSWGHS